MTSHFPIVRSIVYIDGRKVHFRACGDGPVVFLLHGSPQSSWAVLPLAEHLAQQGFCAIAPDTPGYGMSHPLSSDAAGNTTTIDYARSLIALADELGIEKFGLYGFHTGAAIACTAAALYPERAQALTADGLTAWNDEERNTVLQGYIPPFNPQWDGSHMTWVWARIEEQVAFFPWHIAEDRCRMEFDMSPVARLHLNSMDVLRAADGYRHAYHAAFMFKTEIWLPQVQCPTFFSCLASDPLAEHYQRDVFTTHNTETFNSLAAMYDAFTALLQQSPGSHYRARALQGEDNFGVTHGWVGTPGKALSWCGTTKHDSSQPALVLLHCSGGNKEEFSSLVRLLSQQRNVIAFDLPGHGDSEDLAKPPSNVTELGTQLLDHLALLGIQSFKAVGRGLGALVAAWMVKHEHAIGGAVLGLPDVPAQYSTNWASQYCYDLSPEWDGAHLVRAFRIARWERIFFPWFDRTVARRKSPNGLLDANSVHQRACSLLKATNAWPAAVHAETTFPPQALPVDNKNFMLFAVDGDSNETLHQLQEKGITVQPVGSQDAEWFAEIAQL